MADAERLLGGKLRLLRLLGSGGMGEVYLAQHELLGRPCAVKMVRRDLTAEPALAKRFLREAQICSRLADPHIVQISDFGLAEDGRYYLVMEYLEGACLDDVLRQDGPFSPERAVHVARQIAAGLGAAHRAGIVHRDLKPQNVQLVLAQRDPDFVKVLDFGLARIIGGERYTATGEIMGTPAYMSPEQLAASTVDHRADLYSFGVLLFEVLTGRLPFVGSVAQVMLAHQVTEPARPSSLRPGIPTALEAIVLRCLAKRPEERFQSAEELDLALAALGLQQPEPAQAAPRPRAPMPAVRLRSPGAAEASGETLPATPSRPVRAPSVPTVEEAADTMLPTSSRSLPRVVTEVRNADAPEVMELHDQRHRRILALVESRWPPAARPAPVARLLDELARTETRREDLETEVALAQATLEERLEEAGGGPESEAWPGVAEARQALYERQVAAQAGRGAVERLLDRLRDQALQGLRETDGGLGAALREVEQIEAQLAALREEG